MITRLTLHRFKQFRDFTFELRPSGLSLLAGANNSGKSSILHALAVWEFCRTALEMEKGANAFVRGYAGQGLGLGDEEFSPLEVPSLRHLWTNLKTQRDAEPDGYTLKIRCEWGHDADSRELEFGLSLANDRLFVKPTDSNLGPGDAIPRIAYLPPFAGITARETRLPGAIRRRRIGEGLAGAVLRNLLLDMHDSNQGARSQLIEGRSKIRGSDLRRLRENDPWELLQETLRQTFQSELDIAPFREEYHSYIQVDVSKGRVGPYKLTRFPNFKKRDLMVEGSGFLQWLSVYALALDPAINVLLLDEPDAHLHTSLQEHLLERLDELAASQKQILVATHSSEVLRQAAPETIFEVKRGGNDSGYLVLETQKIGLLAGLGSDYAPRVDRIRKTKRLLFVEGASDLPILNILGERSGRPLSDRWVEWKLASGQKERKHVFLALKEEIPELVAMSLRDRDDDPLSSVGPHLEDSFGPPIDDFISRKWRRRYIESYLVWPPALAAASGLPQDEIEVRLRDEHGIAISLDNFTRSDAPPALLDLRAKEVLKVGDEAILAQLPVTAYDVASEMTEPAIPDDIKTILDELAALTS